MKYRKRALIGNCFSLAATWEHGVVCQVGPDGERLAIFDIRSIDRQF
jgi:hypothetical protein